MFDPPPRRSLADEASLTVWLDAFSLNVDRTARNPNLLLWHRKLYLIDHGAALFFHHNWPPCGKGSSPSPKSSTRAAPWATEIESVAAQARTG